MANIRVESREFQVDLGFGRARQPNGELLDSVFKYGSNNAVGTTEEGIQHQGGLFIFPTSAQRVRVKAGGNAADAAGGDGARSVEIFGVKGDGTSGSETLIPAGAAASDWSTETWWRIYRVRPIEVGLYDGTNIGDMVIENETDLDELIYLPAGLGSTLHLSWTTGSDQQALVSTLVLSVESNKAADLRLYTRNNMATLTPPFTPTVIQQEFKSVPAGLFSVPREPFLYLPPLTDVWVNAVVPVGSAQVAASLSIIVAPT